MQSNKKIIMNPPTVFCHLASSLTQSIRSNEPWLIFAWDEEIGSLQPTLFHFSFVDLPVLKSTWKIGGWGQNKSRSAHESRKVNESKGQSGAKETRCQTGTRCGQLYRNEKRRRAHSGGANMFTYLMLQWCWLLHQASKPVYEMKELLAGRSMRPACET